MKKLITVSLLFICVSISFSQSKKKQIETLTYKLDSINSLLLKAIDSNRELNTTKIALESKISLLKKENASKNGEISLNNEKIESLTKEVKSLEQDYQLVVADLILKSDSIEILKTQVDEGKIKAFVSKFYSSLELSPELNEKHYIEGGVKFNTAIINDFIDCRSIYSKERVLNLTGDYHDRYNIMLVSIDLIESDDKFIEVSTTVEYSIYELGTFQNSENLSININYGDLIINKWKDNKVKKMEVAEYEGLEKFNEKDFYKAIGSVNK